MVHVAICNIHVYNYRYVRAYIETAQTEQTRTARQVEEEVRAVMKRHGHVLPSPVFPESKSDDSSTTTTTV